MPVGSTPHRSVQVSGFDDFGHLTPMRRLISASCSSGQRFAIQLPSDSRSPAKPLPSANSSPCRASRGLSPPSRRALPGAPKKIPTDEGWDFGYWGWGLLNHSCKPLIFNALKNHVLQFVPPFVPPPCFRYPTFARLLQPCFEHCRPKQRGNVNCNRPGAGRVQEPRFTQLSTDRSWLALSTSLCTSAARPRLPCRSWQ